MKPFFVSVPHSGEQIPPEATWLKGLPENILMCDVDRYVHELYGPAAESIGIPALITPWHRYAVDCNRVPEDIDQDAVEDSTNPPGKFTIGFHWSQTTTGVRLIKEPITQELHKTLTEKYFNPFHDSIKKMRADLKAKYGKVYHLDAHSMPSQGTSAHRDPGTKRPQIVVSDRDGVSCEPRFKDIVIQAYESVGFQVAYNWPYKGGRVTEVYGKPAEGFHTLQVEMNRSIYMDENSKARLDGEFGHIQKLVQRAVTQIWEAL